MAIAYSLELATPMPAAQVASELCDVGRDGGLFDESVTAERLLDGVATVRRSWVRVGPCKPMHWDPVAEDFGITGTVWAHFRMYKLEDILAEQDDMIRLVAGVLARVPGDAVLHHEFEVVWLMRRAGELTLNERDDLWRPARLAAIEPPYRRVTHTFAG